MIPKPHQKSFSTLVGMSMIQLLSLVKNHHLSSLLGVYKRMNKVQLINALRKYEKTVTSLPKPAKQPGKQPAKQPAKQRVKQPAKQPAKPPPAPKKPKSTVSRTKSVNISNKPSKKRITPTLVKSTSAEPFESKGSKGVATYSQAIKNLEKKASKLDASKKGKKLISNTPVRRSARIKTINNYRMGRNY